MKSFSLGKLIFLITAIMVIFWFRADLTNLYNKLNNLDFGKNSNEIIQQIENKVIAPPPLRTEEESPQSYLTNQGVINQTNKQRLNNGLPVLSENVKLDATAMAKVKEMFQNQYFEHVSFVTGDGPTELAKTANYQFLIVGENLALGNYKDD